MRRTSKLLILVATAAALVLPTSTAAAATTTVTYNIAGIASTKTFPHASFAGAAVSASRTELGLWNSVVLQDSGAVTGGTFTFRSRVHTFDGTLTGGTFAVNTGGTCAKRTFGVHGVMSGDSSFDVTLTHRGKMRAGTCVVYLATVRGTATLAFS